jgi:hypothetical protein
MYEKINFIHNMILNLFIREHFKFFNGILKFNLIDQIKISWIKIQHQTECIYTQKKLIIRIQYRDRNKS